jgi:hypothetical protein
MDTPATDLAGRTTVGTLAALFASARLVVTNDTGASHVAAAVGTRSVVVFPAAGDADRWAPVDTALHRRVQGGGRPAGGGERWPSVGAVLGCVEDQIAGETAATIPKEPEDVAR